MITRISVIFNFKRIYNVEKIIACGNIVALGHGKALVGGAGETGPRKCLLEIIFKKMNLSG